MKVIFLDIDGVLNNEVSASRGLEIDVECVRYLNDIVRATKAYIVVSSTWRGPDGCYVPYISYMLSNLGLHGYVVDTSIDTTHFNLDNYRSTTDIFIGATSTDEGVGGHRGMQIEEWLADHPEVTAYVILDDETDMTDEQKEHHFVRTQYAVGLSRHDADLAVEILHKGPLDK